MTPPDEIWRRIVPPLVAAFVVFLAMVRASARTPTTAVPPKSAGGREFVRYLAVTAVSGYGVFVAIVLFFHVLLARDHGALKSAAWGGAGLLAIALPVFVVAEWLARRSAR